jgi:hypothetical protein
VIIPFYAAFRPTFALAGAATAVDGFAEFPGTAKLRASGFTGLATPTIDSWPVRLTVNALAQDTVPGTHEFDWFLSQRSDLAASQYLVTSLYDPIGAGFTFSGTIEIDLVDANVARLLPGLSGDDLVTATSLALICRDVSVYVRRRSDGAYQWCRLYEQT